MIGPDNEPSTPKKGSGVIIGPATQSARFRQTRSLDEFDFSFNPSIKRKQIHDLVGCQFIRRQKRGHSNFSRRLSDYPRTSMPRTARASVGGMVYHVLNRGNERRKVFRAGGDYRAFLAAPPPPQPKPRGRAARR